MTGSEPFERLLLERTRPVLGRAEAGSDFVVASLAQALDAPVLAVAPGPPEAEVLARGVSAFLGQDRAALFPSWEALPYEDITPSRPGRAVRRRDRIAS